MDNNSLKNKIKFIRKIVLMFFGLLSSFYIVSSIAVVIFISAIMSSSNSNVSLKDIGDLPKPITESMVIGAINSHIKYDVPASVTLAQIILESSGSYEGGLSYLAYKGYNLFGVKAKKGEPYISLDTKEYTNQGASYSIKARFKKYKNFEESIVDHALLLQNKRYSVFTSLAKNSDDYARAVHKGGYASAPNYADELIKIMKEHNLYRFDTKNVASLKGKRGKATGKFIYPFSSKGVITSRFGYRGSISGLSAIGDFHNGLDIAMPRGTPILAIDGGTVTFAGYMNNGGGYSVVINHGNNIQSYYHHIRAGGIKVRENQRVKKGDIIAEVGSTGASTGNHLHLGIKIKGEYVDPMLHIKIE